MHVPCRMTKQIMVLEILGRQWLISGRHFRCHQTFQAVLGEVKLGLSKVPVRVSSSMAHGDRVSGMSALSDVASCFRCRVSLSSNCKVTQVEMHILTDFQQVTSRSRGMHTAAQHSLAAVQRQEYSRALYQPRSVDWRAQPMLSGTLVTD